MITGREGADGGWTGEPQLVQKLAVLSTGFPHAVQYAMVQSSYSSGLTAPALNRERRQEGPRSAACRPRAARRLQRPVRPVAQTFTEPEPDAGPSRAAGLPPRLPTLPGDCNCREAPATLSPTASIGDLRPAFSLLQLPAWHKIKAHESLNQPLRQAATLAPLQGPNYVIHKTWIKPLPAA